jgi:tetratricopeptide (TPR) repeat protein
VMRRFETECRRLAVEEPHPYAADNYPMVGLICALVDGDLGAVDHWSAELERRYAAHGIGDGAVYRSSAQVQMARERGELGAMADLLADIAAQVDAGDLPGVNVALAALAAVEAGRADEALAALDRYSANGYADSPDDAALPICQACWAEVGARLGHRPTVEAMYGALLADPEYHLGTGGWYLGASAYYLGLLAAALGRPDEARSWYEQAVAAHERMESPPWLARTLIDWALLEDGDTRRQLARRAIDVIGDLPLEASRRRALALL